MKKCENSHPFFGVFLRFVRGVYLDRTIVVLQNAQGRTDEIVELSAVRGAEEYPDRDEHDDDAERYEKIERFHELIPTQPRGLRPDAVCRRLWACEHAECAAAAMH